MQAYFWKAVSTMRSSGPINSSAIVPACVALGIKTGPRTSAVDDLHSLGLTAATLNHALIKATANAAPDTLGMDDNEISALPPAVRNIRCGSEIENGDPYCGAEKFNNTVCDNRKYRTSWHPGWYVSI